MAFTDLPDYNMPIFISGVTIASVPIKDKINAPIRESDE